MSDPKLTANTSVNRTTSRPAKDEGASIADQSAKLLDFIGDVSGGEVKEGSTSAPQTSPRPQARQLPDNRLGQFTGGQRGGANPDQVNDAANMAASQGLSSMRAGDLRNLSGGTSAAFAAQAQNPATYKLQSERFKDPVFQEILAGKKTFNEGDSGEHVRTMQASLYALGYDTWPDKSYGGKETKPGVAQYQRDRGLPEPEGGYGVFDGRTLMQLDKDAAAQTAELKDQQLPPGEKAQRYRVVGEIGRRGASPAKEENYLFVIDKNTDEIVAQYVTSPGKDASMISPGKDTIKWRRVREAWVPTQNMKKANPQIKTEPGGPDNPMGLVKQQIDGPIYVHGVPLGRKDKINLLGDKGSSGCFRMSPTNILEMSEKYMEPGTEIEMVHDASDLERKAAAAGIEVRDRWSAGREYLPAYMSGELGKNQFGTARKGGGNS